MVNMQAPIFMGEKRVLLYNHHTMTRDYFIKEIGRIQQVEYNNYLGRMLKYKYIHLIIHRCSGCEGLYKHLRDMETSNKDKPFYLKEKAPN